MTIAFLGLGSMGLPMATNLARSATGLRVYNRTPGRAEPLRSTGAAIVDSAADAVRDADLVFTMLSDDAAVESVVLGENGILRHLRRGAVHASMSTISAGLSERLSAAHQAADQWYVAAPVFGRPEAAEAAKLWIVAGGPAEAIERCRPAFEAMSQGVLPAGEDPVHATVIKIAGNFLLASAIEAMGEAFALLRRAEVDPAAFLEIVNGHLLRSPIYQAYGTLLAEERWQPAGFKLRHGLKDVKLALAAGERYMTPLPLASLMRDNFLEAMAKGWGDDDWAALGRRE
ncbi:MAG: NAD(P)-dependent oxidoreductase [Gemmatimonadales bacterium]